MTALRPGASPAAAEWGSQGLSSSNSPNTIEARPGMPCCTSKSRPTLAPPTLASTSRTARPMVALARLVIDSIS